MQEEHPQKKESLWLTEQRIDDLRALNPTTQLFLKSLLRNYQRRMAINGGNVEPRDRKGMAHMSTCVETIELLFDHGSRQMPGERSYKKCNDGELSDEQLRAEIRRLTQVLGDRLVARQMSQEQEGKDQTSYPDSYEELLPPFVDQTTILLYYRLHAINMDRPLSNTIVPRKRKSFHNHNHSDHDSVLSLTSSAKMNRETDLGALLSGSGLPPKKFWAIQRVLNEQEDVIAERGAEIHDRGIQIRDLKEDLHRNRLKVEVDSGRIERRDRELSKLEKELETAKAKAEQGNVSACELRERKQYFDNYAEEQNQLMSLGRKMLARKTEEAEGFEKEIIQLRAALDERDAMIGELQDQVLRMSMAPPDAMAAMAIEAQAQRTLGLVKGLQKDVADRDAEIANLKAQSNGHQLGMALSATQTKAVNAKLTAKSQALQAVEKQAAEAKSITEDQAKLVQRLMEENARLSGT